MRIAANGTLVGGVAGSGVYTKIGDAPTTRIITAPSGMSNLMDDRVIGFYGPEGNMTIVSCRQDGTDLQTLTQSAASFIVGGRNTWAYTILGVDTHTVTSWGLTIPLAAAMAMLDDGSLIVQQNYQEGLGVACYLPGEMTPSWEVTDADISFRYPYPQLYAVDANRVIWCNADGKFEVYGLPQPDPGGVALVNPFVVTHADGTLWLGFTAVVGDEDQTWVRPWDDATRGYVIRGGYGVTGRGSIVAGAVDASESELWSVEIDWTEPTTIFSGYDPLRTHAPGNAPTTLGQSAAHLRVFKPTNPSRGIGGGSIDEMPSAYSPKYPFVTPIVQTESGHVIEADDTPGAERITVFHRTGSHIEMFPDGSVKVKTTGGKRQDITIGDHDVVVQGDWNVTVDGAVKIYVRQGAMEIQADAGVAVNVKGEMKVHADNITLSAKHKIALSAPFVDLGKTPAGGAVLSIPTNMASLYGVPIPIYGGMKASKTEQAALVASMSNPISAAAVPLNEARKFINYGRGLGASAALLRKIAADSPTEPQFPIEQPLEMPLVSPGVYRGIAENDKFRRERQCETPDDMNADGYETHVALCEELKDYATPFDKLIPGGNRVSIDTTTPDTSNRTITMRPFADVAGKYNVTETHALGTSGLLVKDLMVGFVRPMVEKIPTTTVTSTYGPGGSGGTTLPLPPIEEPPDGGGGSGGRTPLPSAV